MDKIKAFFGSLFLMLLLVTAAYGEEVIYPYQFAADECMGCTAKFEKGTEVTLTATPDPGSVFIKWEGDFCNGSKARNCTFVMPDRDVSINARFDKRLAAPKWRRSIGGEM